MDIYTLIHPNEGSIDFRVSRSAGVRIATSDTKGRERVRGRNITYGQARQYWKKLVKYEGWRVLRLTRAEAEAKRWRFP